MFNAVLENLWRYFRFDFRDEKECHEAIRLSNEAKQLLENELLKKFFIDSEQILIEIYKKTYDNETYKREEIYKYIKVLEKMKEYLNVYVEAGEEARKQLDVMYNKNIRG